jgi:hypothetical protein
MMKKYYRNRHATFIKALLEEKKQKQEQEEIEKLKQEKRKKKLKDKVLNNLIPASRVDQEEESTNQQLTRSTSNFNGQDDSRRTTSMSSRLKDKNQRMQLAYGVEQQPFMNKRLNR